MTFEKALEVLKKEKEVTELDLENGYSSVHMRSFVDAVNVILEYLEKEKE